MGHRGPTKPSALAVPLTGEPSALSATEPTRDDPGRSIGGLFVLGKRYFQERLAEKGLPRVPVPLLLRVLEEPAPSQDELTRHATRDKATISRTLRELEDAGFITRDTDPHDNRLKRVRPTDRARSLGPWLRECLAEWSRVLTEGFTDEERETAMLLLGRMEDNARGRMGCPQGLLDDGPPRAG